MTTIPLPLPLSRRRHRRSRWIRRLDGRWLVASLAVALLATIGGLSLVEVVALMLARVLFIAFSIAFVVTFFVAGLALARRATETR